MPKSTTGVGSLRDRRGHVMSNYPAFFDSDDDEPMPPAAPAPPAPAPAPAPPPACAALPATPPRHTVPAPSEELGLKLPGKSMAALLGRGLGSPTSPAPAPRVYDDEPPEKKPRHEEPAAAPAPAVASYGEASSSYYDGAGGSSSMDIYKQIMADHNSLTSHTAIEENSKKGKSKASAAACACCSSSSSGSARKSGAAKRPRLTAEDLEREADEFEGDIDEIVASEDDEAEVRSLPSCASSHRVAFPQTPAPVLQVDEVAKDDDDDGDDDLDEWPRFDGDGHGPKEPHVLGPDPNAVADSIYPAQAIIPASVNKFLRSYQREGVEWLWKQYTQGKGGVLGDEMGLGKTVQTIAFISAVLGKTATSKDKERSFPLAAQDRRQALIVVPTSTLANWQREFKTWGCFRVMLCHGPKPKQVEAMQAAADGQCEVLLTTYAIVARNAEDFGSIKWAVSIFDEVHLIKNPKGKIRTSIAGALYQAKCYGIFGLSGTPMSNEYKELWSLYDFVSTKNVGDLKDFNSHYSKALKEGQKRKASQFELANRMKKQQQLKKMIDAWMLQRFKTIIKDQMPNKEDNIVFCKLASEQQVVYERILESPDYVALKNAEEPCWCGSGQKQKECHPHDGDGVLWRWTDAHRNGETCSKCPYCIGLPAVTQLLKVANHLELIKPDPKHQKPGSDPYQKATEFARMAFGDEHGESRLHERDVSYLSRSSETSCGKMRAVVALLRLWKAKKAKVLLFSYSTQMLDILEDVISRKGYIYSRLDGSTPAGRRGKLVDDFNNIPEKFIFLLSTKAGGLGLNLVSATVVVVFDPNWNPSFDMQAQDRAYRIGQRHDVQVYRMISTNTVEEKIYQRQLYKQGQEGLVLHQRDENRYWDGVAGDKNQKGELFGYKNLLTFDNQITGAAGGSTTHSLLGRKASNLEGEEDAESLYYINKDHSRVKTEGGEDDGEEGAEDDGEDEFGIGAELNADAEEPQDVAAVLRASGMVHTHVNDRVLGGGSLPKNLSTDDDDLDMTHAPAPGADGARPRPTVKQEVKPKQVKQEGKRTVLHGSGSEVRQLLHECDTYDDFIGDLQEDADFAQLVQRCMEGPNKDTLAARVNALPRSFVAMAS